MGTNERNYCITMGERKDILIDLHYLPSLEFFAAIISAGVVTIEAHEHYQKQSYRNRCTILGANKIQTLSIPIQKTDPKILIKDVKINYTQKWSVEHWRSICSAYGKAPFFEYYASFFENIFIKRPKYLFEFNYQLLTLCLKLLGVKKEIGFSGQYQKKIDQNIFDARGLITPKKNYSDNKLYCPASYYQVFGKEFVPNLSIVDLLFCEGTNSKSILNNSITSN